MADHRDPVRASAAVRKGFYVQDGGFPGSWPACIGYNSDRIVESTQGRLQQMAVRATAYLGCIPHSVVSGIGISKLG
jgi:hypothetical protein